MTTDFKINAIMNIEIDEDGMAVLKDRLRAMLLEILRGEASGEGKRGYGY